ncbi:hypothetical protein GF386_06090 [Candidatus Pacearchaeota archaeon]|nr:hypothetical protein [Candidatus Pacearchaeota archaeon]MBD3283660.1 hypothetical protein [Candidatus Pacearchaeota archaeon]
MMKKNKQNKKKVLFFFLFIFLFLSYISVYSEITDNQDDKKNNKENRETFDDVNQEDKIKNKEEADIESGNKENSENTENSDGNQNLEIEDIESIDTEIESGNKENSENTNNSKDKKQTLETKNMNDTEITNNNNNTQKEKNTYINLDNLTDDNKERKIKEIKKIKITLSKNGKKELEGEIPENIDVNDIQKIETKKSDFKKQVKISSKNHIEGPLKVYADLPVEAEKEHINIYWVNEKKKIEIENYYDENKNGIYERVSWVVPHLSEQVFEIVINFTSENNSESRILLKAETTEGIKTNPINFTIDIDYKYIKDLKCNLTVIGSEYHIHGIENPNKTFSQNLTLPNGDYSWWVFCRDIKRGLTNETPPNSFTISESYSISTDQENYLLGANQDIKLDVSSDNPANATLKLVKPGNTELILTNSLTPLQYDINKNKITQEGNYIINASFDNLAQPYSITKEFAVAKIELQANESEPDKGEKIEFEIDVSSPGRDINYYTLKMDDEIIDINNASEPNQNDFHEKIPYTCDETGNFNLSLKVFFTQGNAIEVKKNGIYVGESSDSEDPEITLLNPEDNLVINNDEITFAYKVDDNIKISNCTLNLYNKTGNGFWELIFPETSDDKKTAVKKNPEHNKRVEIKLIKFDEGDYLWEVECYDNSSNKESESWEFKVEFSNSTTTSSANSFNYSQKNDVDEAMENLDEFLDKVESYSSQQKEILEELDLLKDIRYYKKRLIQIDQDLGNNFDFISDEELKQKRTEETAEEFNEIKERIIKDLRIIKSKEYVKNTLNKDIEKTIKEYLELKNTNLKKSELIEMARINLNNQEYLSVSTKISQVEINYQSKTKKITLVSKKIDLKNNSFKTILEVIPKETIESTDEINFVSDVKIIKKDPLIEINIDDLENKKLVYYTEKLIEPEEFEKTDTILFKEFRISSTGITGFFVFDFDSISDFAYYIILIIAIIIIVYLVILVIKKLRIYNWKKEEDVIRVFDLIKETKRALLREDLSSAREHYHKIREYYPLIPEACKKYLYKHVKKIRIAIDKRDIFNLVKEYEKAKKENRNQDSKELYDNIKDLYKRLPKKYREKIYNRMFKPLPKTLTL